jgi:hypothetical protein
MRQSFKIDESEKKRILEMYEITTKKNYLGEQETQQQQPQSTVAIEGKTYKLPGIVDKASLESFIGDNAFTEQELSELNAMLGTKLQMLLPGGMGSGLGKRALSVVRESLNYLAQVASTKETVCRANFTQDQFSKIPDMQQVSQEISSVTRKTLADVINSKIKTSQYCRS